jgi:hypothetical protein
LSETCWNNGETNETHHGGDLFNRGDVKRAVEFGKCNAGSGNCKKKVWRFVDGDFAAG